jgi:hypothetical protein
VIEAARGTDTINPYDVQQQPGDAKEKIKTETARKATVFAVSYTNLLRVQPKVRKHHENNWIF